MRKLGLALLVLAVLLLAGGAIVRSPAVQAYAAGQLLGI